MTTDEKLDFLRRTGPVIAQLLLSKLRPHIYKATQHYPHFAARAEHPHVDGQRTATRLSSQSRRGTSIVNRHLQPRSRVPARSARRATHNSRHWSSASHTGPDRSHLEQDAGRDRSSTLVRGLYHRSRPSIIARIQQTRSEWHLPYQLRYSSSPAFSWLPTGLPSMAMSSPRSCIAIPLLPEEPRLAMAALCASWKCWKRRKSARQSSKNLVLRLISTTTTLTTAPCHLTSTRSLAPSYAPTVSRLPTRRDGFAPARYQHQSRYLLPTVAPALDVTSILTAQPYSSFATAIDARRRVSPASATSATGSTTDAVAATGVDM